MTLAEQGFRLIWRNGEAKWVHPAQVGLEDIDLTDLSDDELLGFLENDSGIHTSAI